MTLAKAFAASRLFGLKSRNRRFALMAPRRLRDDGAMRLQQYGLNPTSGVDARPDPRTPCFAGFKALTAGGRIINDNAQFDGRSHDFWRIGHGLGTSIYRKTGRISSPGNMYGSDVAP